MCEVLDEILIIAKKALATAESEVVDAKVETINKGFISIGGSLDSIILLCEDKKVDPHKDNMDRGGRHSIAGHMNDPSETQKDAFDAESD